jgi:hypothetical protein
MFYIPIIFIALLSNSGLLEMYSIAAAVNSLLPSTVLIRAVEDPSLFVAALSIDFAVSGFDFK